MTTPFPSATAALTRAEQLCRNRGSRLTPQRREVLSIIHASPRPLGAYDILEVMRHQHPRIAPPTVYRALDFLLAEGLIHKLESLHAFVDCRHADHPHTSQFLICSDCGGVDELHSANVQGSLTAAAQARGFAPDHSTIEVRGRCAQCVEKA